MRFILEDFKLDISDYVVDFKVSTNNLNIYILEMLHLSKEFMAYNIYNKSLGIYEGKKLKVTCKITHYTTIIYG